MKKLLLSFCCLAFCFAANAISLESVTQDLSAKDITCGSFEQIKTVSTSKGSRDIKSSGTFVLCDQGIMWNTVKPVASKLIVTETKIIQIDSKNNKSIIDGKDNATFASFSAAISTVFKNNLSLLKQQFNIEFTEGQDQSWKIRLTPKDATIAAVIKEFFLEGTAKKEAVLDSLVITEKNGSLIKYVFTDQSYQKTQDYDTMLSYLE